MCICGLYAKSAMNTAQHKIINIINRDFFFLEIHGGRGHIYVCHVHSRYPLRPEESDFLELEL